MEGRQQRDAEDEMESLEGKAVSTPNTPHRKPNSSEEDLLRSLSKVSIHDEFYFQRSSSAAVERSAFDDQEFAFRKRPPPSPAFSPIPSLHAKKSAEASPALKRMIKFVCKTPAPSHDKARDAVAVEAKTLIVYPPECLHHHTGHHQENRNRLLAICGPEGILREQKFSSTIWAEDNVPFARDGDILRVHDFGYYQHLKKICSRLPEQADSGHTTFEPSGQLDFDSPLSKKSLEAARHAAGAVCYAVDRVMCEETRNAFVAVRPPGHHAGSRGCVPSKSFSVRPEMCSCGFCLLNSVAIGAAYALNKFAPSYASVVGDKNPLKILNRVAIIDFDIHHGNGTEEIIRNLVPHEEQYPLPSSWETMKFSSYKPWRDAHDIDNVFFGSIHLYDQNEFYPGSGEGPGGDSPELQGHPNIVNMALKVLGPKFVDVRSKLSSKARKAFMKEASKAFQDEVRNRLLPSLKQFDPDIIFISAGFDGHADDYYYFLTEEDYYWITMELKHVAESHCNGRIVSVLEGGYNLEVDDIRSKRTIKMQPSDFTYGSLARSCAAHVEALMRNR